MIDKNGIEIKTGDIVEITGAYFKCDNGLYLVKHSPGDPTWSGTDHSLTKISKSGKLSTAKHRQGFWPIMSFVSDHFKSLKARRWNKEHAQIEIVSVKDMAPSVAYFRGKIEGIQKDLRRVTWDFGENSEPAQKDRAMIAHYEAVIAYIEKPQTTGKKSDEVKAELETAKAEYDAAEKREVYDNPEHTAENHNAMWAAFWNSHGNAMRDRIRELEDILKRELNREIAVGDGVTLHLHSDNQAHTVIARTEKTLTIQRDKATLDPDFKPEWTPGGFSAICTNSEDQKWTYERDPQGSITRCHWSEKCGAWRAGSDGSMAVSRGRHEHYDYNF